MSDPKIVSQQELVIEAGGTDQQYWKDIWRYRELFYFLYSPNTFKTFSKIS